MTELLWDGLHGHPVRNSHAQVVDRVGAAIVRGRFAEGESLPSDEDLATTLKVSRTVLREAFKTLAAKGLLVARARIGTKVRPRVDWNMLDGDVLRWHLDVATGADFVRDLAEMRLGVEPHAAGLAAERADYEATERIWTALKLMEMSDDPAQFAYADYQFHREVLRASGNVFMHSVGALIEAALLASFRISSPFDSYEGRNQSALEHQAIVGAIADRDRPRAEAAMRHVIIAGRDRVAGAL